MIMKTWGQMTKEEKLEILSAVLDDNKSVESYHGRYENGKIVDGWHDTGLQFFWDDIHVRIKS